MVGEVGADPTTPEETDLQSAAVADLLLPHKAGSLRLDSAHLTSGRLAMQSTSISATLSRNIKIFLIITFTSLSLRI